MSDIVIFGTGIDGRRIYRFEKKRNKNKIIAFLENDKNKIGKFFFNLPIIGIDHLSNIKFSKSIFLLGGRYMDDQFKQLKNVKINLKNIIKTKRWKYKFSKKEIIFREKKTKQILADLLKIFVKNNINYFIDGSSFLALMRKQKLSEFTDVDISIIDSNYDNLIKDLKPLQRKYKIFFSYYKKSHFLFKKGNLLQIVILSKNNEKKYEPAGVEIYTEFLYKKNYYRIVPINIINRVPQKFRDKAVKLNYDNLKLRVTNLKNNYAKFSYGPQWKKKDNNWKKIKLKKKEITLKEFKK
jgi:hypothetical protein